MRRFACTQSSRPTSRRGATSSPSGKGSSHGDYGSRSRAFQNTSVNFLWRGGFAGGGLLARLGPGRRDLGVVVLRLANRRADAEKPATGATGGGPGRKGV